MLHIMKILFYKFGNLRKKTPINPYDDYVYYRFCNVAKKTKKVSIW